MKIFCLRQLIFLFTVLVVFHSKAQEQFSFHHLSVEEGLSQSTVFCIHQDKQGLLWIGTYDGLNKYDGTKFTHYKHDPADTNSLPAPAVLRIFEDNDGELLIGTEGGGLAVFNKLNERFKRYKNNPADKNSISSNRVTSICHNEGNLYWVSTFYGGLNLFDKSSGRFSAIKHKEDDSTSLSSNHISKVIQTGDGLVWMATRGGLNVLDKKTGKIICYKNNPSDPNSIFDNRVQEIYEDKTHHIWLGTFNGGICEFDRKTKKFIRYADAKETLPGNYFINCFAEDSHNRLWIGTNGGGLKLLDKTTEKINGFKNDPENKNTISNNEIYSLLFDNNGILWVGTNGGGLNLNEKKFGFFNRYSDAVKKNFINKNIYSIYKGADELLWTGSNGGGLNSLNTQNNSVINYSNNRLRKNSISSNDVWCIREDKEKNLWVGTNGGGLNYFNIASHSFITFKQDTSKKNSLSSNNVWCIYEDRDGLIWIGTQQGGLTVYERKENKFIRYKNDNSANSLNSNSIFSIVGGEDSLIYIGTQGGGLNLFDKANQSFKSFTNNPGDKFSINNNDVFCIYIASDTLIWLGTDGGGINVFNKKKQLFLHYTEKDGLPNNVVYGILADKKGNLWLSTNKGICKFTPPEKLDFDSGSRQNNETKPVCRNYDASDGLPSDEFNQGAYYSDRNGTMYFGGINGIAVFHPDSVPENFFKPPVIFTRFKVFEKDYPLDTLVTYKKKVVLSYDQNFFSFEFAALNYLLPEKNSYAVMMEDFDHDWIYTGSRHYASYTNLNPGEYTFKVKAGNNDGVWNDRFSSFGIVITPPFWMTWWFKLAALLLFLTIVYAIYKIRVRQVRKEEAQKTAFNKSLAEVEMKALRAQMNPHFIFNSLQSIGKYMMNNDKENANEYLSRFSKLMRLILENSRKQEVSLEKDLAALELYMQLESLRFKKRFQYRVEIDSQIDKETTLIPPLLLQPFIENSIIHGIRSKEDGMIHIKIKKENGMMLCILEDNGIGREESVTIEGKEKKRESLGMKITQERLNIINRQKKTTASVNIIDVKDSKNKPAGVRVELMLPFEEEF